MIANRSVPTHIVLPHLAYQDVAAAAAWLTRVFGFVEHYRYGTPVAGVQMYAGGALIMLMESRGAPLPAQIPGRLYATSIFLDDVESHYARSSAEGADIVEELHETVYGEVQYGVKDLDGHLWIFSRHARDVAPEEWGATVRQP
jgi:uncharacterized glyoxalase superfamily protein PhnB